MHPIRLITLILTLCFPMAALAEELPLYASFTDTAGKTQSPCPAQTKGVGVLLAIGQSNAANYGKRKFTTQYPQKVLNYYEGKCYVAASPLLGSTNRFGEFITPLADLLIKNRTYQSVIIISSAVGGSEIARWQQGHDLNNELLTILKGARKDYQPTDILWHQGESDLTLSTAEMGYMRSFHSMLASLKESDVNAPVFIAIATRCSQPQWDADNPVATAQRKLIDNQTIFLGANTDALVPPQDRQPDGCHFTESGQLKVAKAYAAAITKAHRQ